MNGHECRRPVARFGEVVQFKLAGDHVDKAETMWRRGVFLGMNSKSIDSIISTQDGIQLARTVRAVPEDEMLKFRKSTMSPIPEMPRFQPAQKLMWMGFNSLRTPHRTEHLLIQIPQISIQIWKILRRHYLTPQPVQEECLLSMTMQPQAEIARLGRDPSVTMA